MSSSAFTPIQPGPRHGRRCSLASVPRWGTASLSRMTTRGEPIEVSSLGEQDYRRLLATYACPTWLHRRISAFTGPVRLTAAICSSPAGSHGSAARTGGEGACRQADRRDVPGLRHGRVLFRDFTANPRVRCVLALRCLESTAADGIRAAERTGAAFVGRLMCRPLPALQRGGQWGTACGSRRCAWLCLLGILGRRVRLRRLGERHSPRGSGSAVLRRGDHRRRADQRRAGACR